MVHQGYKDHLFEQEIYIYIKIFPQTSHSFLHISFVNWRGGIKSIGHRTPTRDRDCI